MTFKELNIGDSFDFVDDTKLGYNSFFQTCVKTSMFKYDYKYSDFHRREIKIGCIYTQVFHVKH